jgi:hypothetical protein
MQQPVGKRRLPMVNMGDDAEIANMRCVHLQNSSGGTACRRPKNYLGSPTRQPSQKGNKDNQKTGEEKEICGKNAELNHGWTRMNTDSRKARLNAPTRGQSLGEATDGSPRLQPWDFNVKRT